MLTLEQPPPNNLSVSAASDAGVGIADETVVVVWETADVEVNVVAPEDGFFFFDGRVAGDEAGIRRRTVMLMPTPGSP